MPTSRRKLHDHYDFDSNHTALYYQADGAQPTRLDATLIKHTLNKATWSWTPDTVDTDPRTHGAHFS